MFLELQVRRQLEREVRGGVSELGGELAEVSRLALQLRALAHEPIEQWLVACVIVCHGGEGIGEGARRVLKERGDGLVLIRDVQRQREREVPADLPGGRADLVDGMAVAFAREPARQHDVLSDFAVARGEQVHDLRRIRRERLR